MTKYFVDQAGNYIGAFDGAEPPAGCIEVLSAPDDARQCWNGEGWGAIAASKDQRKDEITAHLARIDAESSRPLRAKAAGNATAADDAKLAALDANAVDLRKELAGL